ncbi:hypothetical protein D049_3167B, partial [Vibrio parahaemolyticus VPTS-2010]
TTAMRWFSFV